MPLNKCHARMRLQPRAFALNQEKARRVPHPSLSTFYLNHETGCPILRRACEGWETTKPNLFLPLLFCLSFPRGNLFLHMQMPQRKGAHHTKPVDCPGIRQHTRDED